MFRRLRPCYAGKGISMGILSPGATHGIPRSGESGENGPVNNPVSAVCEARAMHGPSAKPRNKLKPQVDH